MALEAGAAGIIFPMISCGDQIKSLIQDSSWPPSGNRGVGFQELVYMGKVLNLIRILQETHFL